MPNENNGELTSIRTTHTETVNQTEHDFLWYSSGVPLSFKISLTFSGAFNYVHPKVDLIRSFLSDSFININQYVYKTR